MNRYKQSASEGRVICADLGAMSKLFLDGLTQVCRVVFIFYYYEKNDPASSVWVSAGRSKQEVFCFFMAELEGCIDPIQILP